MVTNSTATGFSALAQLRQFTWTCAIGGCIASTAYTYVKQATHPENKGFEHLREIIGGVAVLINGIAIPMLSVRRFQMDAGGRLDLMDKFSIMFWLCSISNLTSLYRSQIQDFWETLNLADQLATQG